MKCFLANYRRLIVYILVAATVTCLFVYIQRRSEIGKKLQMAGFKIRYDVPTALSSCPRWSSPLATFITHKLCAVSEVSGWGLVVTSNNMLDIASCSELHDLEFNQASLPSNWTQELASLQELYALCLAYIPCKADAVDRITHSASLRELVLIGCGLNDSELDHINECRSLTNVDLSYNAITDAGIAHLTNMTQLQRLRLAGTGIGDQAINRIAYLTNLVDLDLSDTSISGDIQGISRMQFLRSFAFNDNIVTPNLLVVLAELPNLQTLDLSHCTLSQDEINSLVKMRSLRHLRLDGSGISKQVFAQLQRMLPDCTLY
jgi:Leucine-rich repeat (LRR) protein